jgi:hypothetical protein
MKTAALDDKTLNRECSVFSVYLIGEPPSEYVKRKYRAAHQTGSLLGAAQPAENFLVRVATIAPWTAKIIDAYTRIFRPFSTVRKKLVLLLAILESCAPTHARLDSADSSSILVLLMRLVNRCLTFVLLVVLGIFLILPAEWILRGKAKCIALSLRPKWIKW